MADVGFGLSLGMSGIWHLHADLHGAHASNSWAYIPLTCQPTHRPAYANSAALKPVKSVRLAGYKDFHVKATHDYIFACKR